MNLRTDIRFLTIAGATRILLRAKGHEEEEMQEEPEATMGILEPLPTVTERSMFEGRQEFRIPAEEAK